MSARAAAPVTCAGLQPALNAAVSGDVVTLAAGQVCGGSITVPAIDLTLAGGAGSGFQPTTDARSLTAGGANLTLRNLDFAGRATPGDPGGGLAFTGLGALTLDHTTFHDISSAGSGGGALVFASGATITGSAFRNNTSALDGGGLALNLIGGATLTGNTFAGNEAGSDQDGGAGGGLFLGSWAGPVICRVGCSRQAANGIEVGHNVYDGNSISSFNFDPARGGGAFYNNVHVTATATETYRFNHVDSGWLAEGGGFAVASSQGGQSASYTGVNTVVLGNTADAYSNGESTGLARGAGIAVIADEHATQLALSHATIIHNRVTNVRVPQDPIAAGIYLSSNDGVAVIRSILFDNTLEVVQQQGDRARRAAVDGPQIAGAPGAQVDRSIFCDVFPPVNGNLCATPLFETATTARQATGSPSIDKVPPLPNPVLVDFEDESRPVTITNAATPWDMGADEVQARGTSGHGGQPSATPTPGVTPAGTPGVTPTPGPGVTPTPTPGGGVKGDVEHGGKKRHVCAGRRRFRILVRLHPGVTWVRAQFRLRGRRIPTRRFHGRLGAIVDLRHIPRRTIVLRITAVSSTGAVVHGKRVYHPCRKKRPHTIPELR